MNLIILFGTDFIDKGHDHVRLAGLRKEHVLTVCRAVPGEALRVGLLNGNIGTGTLVAVTETYIEMAVTLDSPPPAPLPLTLVLALPRPKALKRCIEAVTAMGVKRTFIIQSWRVEKSYWKSPVLTEEILREHMLLGLEQAGDTILPTIELRKKFKPFVEDEVPELIKGTRALAAHPYAEKPFPFQSSGPVTLAIGPEGGFIPYEIDLLQKQGFEAASLGKRVLRVEHAVPALIGRLF